MIAAHELTWTELTAAIAAKERAPRDDAALRRACIDALRSTGTRLPGIPSAARVVRVWSPNGCAVSEELGRALLNHDEVLIASAPLPSPFQGVVAVITPKADVPKPAVEATASRHTELRAIPGGLKRRDVPAKAHEEMDERSAMLLLMEELGGLAADLWFDGTVEPHATEKEPADAHDE